MGRDVNEYEQYLLFTLCHYHSYLKKISLHNLTHTKASKEEFLISGH